MTSGQLLGIILAQTTELAYAFMMLHVDVTNVATEEGGYLQFTLLERGVDFSTQMAGAIEHMIHPMVVLVGGVMDMGVLLVGSL